jgi:YVTN family beta-propeller protein
MTSRKYDGSRRSAGIWSHEPCAWSAPLVMIAMLLALVLPAARAAGPGLPNLSYGRNEILKPLSLIKSNCRVVEGVQQCPDRRGEGTVMMYDGYLFVPYGKDSGQAGGGFAFWDISDPRVPVEVKRMDVAELREPHGFGFSNSYPGRYAAMQAINGVQFWDFSNPLTPVLIKYLRLPGIAESDYDLGNWWVFWQAPYVYIGGSGNGLYIVNAADPGNPVHVKTIPTSAWGGFRVGPTFAVGNLLVMTSMDQAGLVTMDISDPVNPRLLASTSTTAGHYSGIVNGDRIITAGTDQRLHVYDISNPSAITQTVQSSDLGGKGGYVSIQDGFAHAGFSSNYAKVDLTTGAVAATATSGIPGRDEDFATVFGNLVLIGDDHGNGSALVAHQAGRDLAGPSVNMVSPKSGAVGQALTSRIGVTLTDNVDLRTVGVETFIVRPRGGSALAGKYSAQSGIVNFSPDAPLAPSTTYEVVIPAGGMKDDAGNGVPKTFTASFTTAGGSGPRCTLTGARSPALVSSTVTFKPGAAIGRDLQYSWNFGDGSATPFSRASTATHAYAQPGHYPVILTVRSGTSSSTCSTNQTIHTARTAAAPTASSTMAFDAARNRVWVVNSDADTVTAVDTNTLGKVLETAVGDGPQTIAQAPDGRIWVANAVSGTVSVLNPDTGAVVQTLALPAGSRPFGIAFSRNGAAAYVTLQGVGLLAKLHPATGALQGTVPVGATPRGIAITGDSSRIFVTRFVSPATEGQVIEVDGGTFSVTRTIALATDPGPDTESSGRGVPNYLNSIAIQPDGKRAWIPSKKDNTLRGLFRDGKALTFESTVRTIVSQIDLTTHAEVPGSRLDLNDRDMANVVAFSPLGDYAFVSTQGSNQIEVIDAYSRQISTGIVDVGRAPRGLLITPGGRLFVQNFMSRSVSVYDVSGILNSTSNAAPQLADISTVAAETLPANVLRGKRIFYNAADRRMSRDGYISCASCHQDGGSDGRVFDFTDRGEGLRKTISLNGRRGSGHGRVHWTGNFDEIQDFEHDIRGGFGGLGFMSDSQFNTGTRNTALGDTKAGISEDLDALAAYVTSLGKVGRSPFRNPDGSLTADGAAGQAIFRGAGKCISCHSGPDFTDSASGTLRDVGTIKPSSGQRMGASLTGFDTPTLRGVWDSAPYLHDGSAATLLDVLKLAKATGKHGNVQALTPIEMNQLVSYLQQIDDTESPATPDIADLSVKAPVKAVDATVPTDLVPRTRSARAPREPVAACAPSSSSSPSPRRTRP